MNNRWLTLLFFLASSLLCISCVADYQVSDKSEVRVVIDSYIQPDKLEMLDVLVVLDTSGSMRDNYDDVADGMEILRTDIEGLTLDYQFGYITMDPTNLGYLGPYSSNSSAIDMLMAPSLLPMTGLEEGFAATYNFFSSGDAYDFSRPEADFLLFLISDEDEQSAISADLFYEWLHGEFKHVKHDTVVITQLEGSECGYAYDIGEKYEELALLYGKGPLDICAEDWSVWLSDSSYLTQRKDYIMLSEEEPILDSIIVYINQSITHDWKYINTSNKIQLGFIPAHGSVVEVGYNVYKD